MNFCLEPIETLLNARKYVSDDVSLYSFILTTEIDGTNYKSLENFSRIYYELHHSTGKSIRVFAPRISFEGVKSAEDIAGVLYSGECFNFGEKVDISSAVREFILKQIATSIEIGRAFGILNKLPCILFSSDLDNKGNFTEWEIVGYQSHEITHMFRVVSHEIERSRIHIDEVLRNHANKRQQIDIEKRNLEAQIENYEHQIGSIEFKIEKLEDSISTSRKNIAILDLKAKSILATEDEDYISKHHKVFEGQIDLKRHIKEKEAERNELIRKKEDISMSAIEKRNKRIVTKIKDLERQREILLAKQREELKEVRSIIPNPIDIVKSISRKHALKRFGKGVLKESKNYIPFKDIIKGGLQD